MDFTGKCALVTGAAGGIGGAIVRMLRAAGAGVAAADRDVLLVKAEAHLPGDLTDAAYADNLPAAAAAALGGLDTIVFTAGIGENSSTVRQLICDRLGWMGVELDAEANRANAAKISRPEAAIEVLVIATNEEQVIAKAALNLVGGAA